ncbi:sensor histidine kinase [Sulfitobacter noctilucicola]|uniref:histidine kinase n=2 Tax=Sulfitobacter noctilucicola TaxID=1342301 RepID=A0A7W6M6G1_9RHOB|nr:sensor histidine kinase [Sulfitobacter noctilucicola]MBB4173299.1 two-component system sensor histidine kinase TctE [Sulfitobacter noctilucicola]
MKLKSLRARLTLIILPPLLVISLIAAAWQFDTTTDRAENIFDRGLLSAALAISRDVALSDGDAISPSTQRLLNDTSGGPIFYHVYAPDGVFVTGYSTPPVLPSALRDGPTDPQYYNSTYQSENVRVLRYRDSTVVSGVAGVFSITVWQSAQVRSSFVRDVLSRSFAVITLLVLCVAVVVWFGVGLGLRPLLDLERAIAERSPTELKPIRRAVPVEAQGLVSTLNALLDRISRRISSKDEFISNAAHQLRNPVAGVLALAEAVENAPTAKAAQRRSAELLLAAKEASDLTNKLLSFERASGADILRSGLPVELGAFVRYVGTVFSQQNPQSSVELIYALPTENVIVTADTIMLQEAVLNLLTNSITHGGPDLTQITLDLSADGSNAVLIVSDDGIGIPVDRHIEALSRFSQAGGGPGSGLGLPIASRVMQNHDGRLELLEGTSGASIKLTIPLAR